MIVVWYVFAGLFWWLCIAAGQIIVASRAPEGSRCKYSGAYWCTVVAIVGVSFTNAITFVVLGMPVLVVLTMPFVLLGDLIGLDLAGALSLLA